MSNYCATQNCTGSPLKPSLYCFSCLEVTPTPSKVASLAVKYPKYYKDVQHLHALDVYGVCGLFRVEDPSGALQHSIKKLLLSGVRTGGKSKAKDITEARDTLNRWLELNPEQP